MGLAQCLTSIRTSPLNSPIPETGIRILGCPVVLDF